MGENQTNKLLYVVGLAVLAVITLFFFSAWKLVWLVLYLILGLASLKKSERLFVFFLANVVLSLAWAIKIGALSSQTLSLFLMGLVSALGFVSAGANLGKKRREEAGVEEKKEEVKKTAKKAASKKSSGKKGTKKSSKASSKKKGGRKR